MVPIERSRWCPAPAPSCDGCALSNKPPEGRPFGPRPTHGLSSTRVPLLAFVASRTRGTTGTGRGRSRRALRPGRDDGVVTSGIGAPIAGRLGSGEAGPSALRQCRDDGVVSGADTRPGRAAWRRPIGRQRPNLTTRSSRRRTARVGAPSPTRTRPPSHHQDGRPGLPTVHHAPTRCWTLTRGSGSDRLTEPGSDGRAYPGMGDRSAPRTTEPHAALHPSPTPSSAFRPRPASTPRGPIRRC
jgi:hypothetical protein